MSNCLSTKRINTGGIMIVILLASSAPQVGKSTFSQLLTELLPNSCKYSFAYPIKEITYNLYVDVMKKFRKRT